ncbi:serine-rich adhesin for platelets-like [Anopheles ziemanni]|uniref:serine-rich adhesin for platelets-like n=1 Tax=Anopheles coustani TaxID=139045 RepID=UPI002658FBE8|nr:serine-rich adhesin for platelets-like [Anopheles coustani]XP_058170654.1 serine-rich adhesin for platelets-like [Anopheles ziemanni]
MTKKKPSPQNRIWEKERRERLNKTFEDLHRLLPDHEPSSTLTKVEILQRAIELIGKLQKKIKDLMQECNDPLKEQLCEQEKRLKRLLGRNEELTELLRKSKITVPPCKYTIAEEERQQRSEEKENGNLGKKSGVKRARSGVAAAKKQPVINAKHQVSLSNNTVGSDAVGLDAVKSVAITSNVETTTSSIPGSGGIQPAPSASALRHINGINIVPGHGVNVTPALLSTPIMTTSVLISNNGNLMQMPLVAPPSSLLIVGNDDVRAKINLKNRPPGGKGRTKRGKFMIKSIDVIPGRIVNGKIPIPPLKRSTTSSESTSLKGSKIKPKLKRKKSIDKGKKPRKQPVVVMESAVEKVPDESGPNECKRLRKEDAQMGSVVEELHVEDSKKPQEEGKEPLVAIVTEHSGSSIPIVGKTIRKEHETVDQTVNVCSGEPQGAHLDHINIGHSDLSDDIFANLQVPGDSHSHGNHDDGSLSPTAAYLMNFPLVAGGGKAAGNHIEAADGEECDEGATTVTELQAVKKDNSAETVLATGGTEPGGSLMLDNFSSFFNYGQMETICGSGPPAVQDIPILQSSLPVSSTSNVATVTTVAAPSTRESGFSSYTTIYQSIDNMLDHRPSRTSMGVPTKVQSTSESDYGASVAFTFTLTSGTSTAPSTSTTMASNNFFGSTCGVLPSNPVKPVIDDFSSPLKPSIEFTFSLTSSTSSQPRTVQSQYTNSTILAATMTTPSYDTYGSYYHKTVPQTVNYCPSFGVLDPLLTTEKPATSFTFSLTSSTKTEPSYTQSSFATIPLHTSQTYETGPKVSTKHPAGPAEAECFSLKNTKMDRSSQRLPSVAGTAPPPHNTNGVQQQQTPATSHSQQQTTSSTVAITSQQSSQSRYDVSWMAAGTHNDSVASTTISATTTTTTTTIHHHSQQQQQQPYELAPAQIISSLDFPPTGGYSANYKSDIFFAHPPGEENNLTWSSPSKLSNILNDSSSPYFPPVTLPSLNGDLALNTSIGTGTGSGVGPGVSTGQSFRKKGHTHTSAGGNSGQGSDATQGSTFLSVSQLVNQPSKPSYNATSCGQANKPLNNNYSAEALIGSNNSYNSNAVSLVSAGHETMRKDKLFDYGCNIMEGGFGSSSVSTSGALTFNFDSYGSSSVAADYNKGYNFASQQNAYVPPTFGTDGVGYGAVPGSAGCSGSASTSSQAPALPYFGKSTSQGYYQQAAGGSNSNAPNYPHASVPQSASSVGQDFTPYYLPAFGEKPTATNKHYHTITHCTSGNVSSNAGKAKKSHKAAGFASSTVDYAFPAIVTSTAGYSYHSLASSTTSATVPSSATVVSGGSTQQAEPHMYPHYNHHQQQEQRSQNHHQYGGATSEGSSTEASNGILHKSSSAGSFNYRQYSSSSAVPFGSAKSNKTAHHERSHHSGYPSVAGANHQAHSHLDVSCPPATPAGYGTTTNYGTSVSSNHGRQPYSALSNQNTSQHHHHHHQHQQLHEQPNTVGTTAHIGAVSATTAGSCGTITNFNLSTICPEINDKTGRSRDESRGSGAPTVASIMTHW